MTFIYQTLYNFGISVYGIFIYLASKINHKAKLRFQGNSHWKSIPIQNTKLAWFHCASLGEFEQGRPVLEAFKKELPDYKILLTFFSPSGFLVRKNYAQADFITYLPLDCPSNARGFIDHFKPTIAFFVKYEFWRNFSLELKKRGIPLISFSSNFRKNQIYFQPFGRYPKQTLSAFDHFFVQNIESEKLLNSIGIKNVTIAGDSRYDRVKTTKETCKPISIVENFKNEAETIVVGSAWQEDMEFIIYIINDLAFANKKFIIAPHEINIEEIHNWAKKINHPVQLYTNFDTQIDAKVLFIDNVGMLSAIYQYGYAAFVGGAFGKGLHNILEPAVFGIPVFFGNKNYEKFQEAQDLLELGSAKAVGTVDELKNELILLENFELRKSIQDKNAIFIEHHLGASQKVINYCNSLLRR